MILHSLIIGAGKPLLILHGFLGMSDNWKTLGKKYAEEGFQVHLIDQRNHGRSFHHDDFGYEYMVEDLYNYCKDKDLESVSLLGHSMGGKTVMLFATMYSTMVERLIVADIAPKFYPVHHQDILEGLKSLDFEVVKTRKEADEIVSEKVSHIGTRQFLLKNLYWVEKGCLGLRMNLSVLDKNIDEIGVALPTQAVFDGKTLFLRGDRSEYIAPSDVDLINSHFSDCQILTISNAGHWLHAENPKDFFDKSLSFLSK